MCWYPDPDTDAEPIFYCSRSACFVPQIVYQLKFDFLVSGSLLADLEIASKTA